MNNFLARSPRTAIEVKVMLKDKHWQWRYGKAEDVESPVFEIGSVGKTFTATLLALLVHRRQVSLLDTVANYYPQLPWAKHVTLQQLASHTSGLPANPFSQWRLMRHGRKLAEAFQEDDLIVFLQQLPPVLKGAGKSRYSNVGMALLGRILGDVCGQSYGAAVQERILRPLGMHETHLDPGLYDARRLIQGHDSRGRPVPPFTWKGMEAAGLWRTTGDDIMTFLRAQMGFHGSPWDLLADLNTQPRTKIRIMKGTQVGLGWMLTDFEPWGRVAWHGGGTFGHQSMVAWSLDRLAAVVVLTDRMSPWWHHLVKNRQLELIPQRLVEVLSQESKNG